VEKKGREEMKHENLRALKHCRDGLDFAEKYDTMQDAWDACERGDWMLWLAGRLSGKPGSNGRKKLVLAACECARLSLRYVQARELRPLAAIETAEAWARGGSSSLDEVRRAAAASDAVASASVACAAYAASTASAAYAAYASYAAASTASAAVEARKKTLKQSADIVREHYPKAPRLPNRKDEKK
jgi:hypothetical protein